MGAPPQVVERLVAARQEFEARQRSSMVSGETIKDPELDQFMVCYKLIMAYTLFFFFCAN